MIIRLLQPSDTRSGFGCGNPDYDDYIRKYAGQNDFRHHVGRTLVVVDDERVVAYATFAISEMGADEPPDSVAKGMPRYPVPVLRLARLAVDERYQGIGLGVLLVNRVLGLALQLRSQFGCVAVVVDALRSAEEFYERLGFERSGTVVGRPRVAGTVFMSLPLSYVEASLAQAASRLQE